MHATGEGLKKAFVGRNNVFTVDCSKAGGGQLEVAPLMDASIKIDFEIEEVSSRVYRVSYLPKKPGKIKLHIRWSKSEIPGSPFTLAAIDPSKCSVSGPVITGEFGIVGRPSTIQVMLYCNNISINYCLIKLLTGDCTWERRHVGH